MVTGTEATSIISSHSYYYSTDSSYCGVGSHVITYASGGDYNQEAIPEVVNLTDWKGLSKWAIGFSGASRKCPVSYVIRQPARERGQKRKMRLQKMR